MHTKRKKLQKSNDVDGSSNTTEDRIITRKRHLREEDVVSIRYTNIEHHKRVLAFENPTIVSTQEGPKHVQRFTFVDRDSGRKAARHIIMQRRIALWKK
ncbi:hypothetical protein Leryth_000761 [Lithospermum erythrorhizon]|nr:hypothetical protein Leryth_000761 [Lithospermum erythrorhizon]